LLFPLSAPPLKLAQYRLNRICFNLNACQLLQELLLKTQFFWLCAFDE
jgi:hypothetical protein